MARALPTAGEELVVEGAEAMDVSSEDHFAEEVLPLRPDSVLRPEYLSKEQIQHRAGAPPGSHPTGSAQFESTHEHEQAWQEPPPLVKRTSPSPRPFQILQQWEGIVREVTSDSVWAELIDLTDQARPDEEVELPLEEIPRSDWPILKPGSVFYWAIGREWSPGGQMRRVSEIRMRRMPQWTQHSVKTLHSQGAVLMDRFGGGREDPSTKR